MIETTEPEYFIRGDTVKFKKYFSDYLPADGWVLSYSFVQSGDQQTVTATDNGDGYHLVTITAAESIDYKIGFYHYQAVVTKAAERYTVSQGQAEIKPDFATLANGYDARSQIKRTLDAIDSLIENKANEDVSSVSINGRSLTTLSPGELLQWRNHYADLYKKELNTVGDYKSNFIKTRF